MKHLLSPKRAFAMALLVSMPLLVIPDIGRFESAKNQDSQPATKPVQSKLVPKVVIGAEYTEADDGNYEIKVPVSNPEQLPAGTKVIAFEFTLNANEATLEGFGLEGGDIATTKMQFLRKNNYVIIMGKPRLNRVTGIAKRADGQAFKPGSYTFGVYVNGNREKPEAEVRFTIK